MLTQDQLEMRKSGIGGSEIAAICGLNRYKSALAVYMDKTGQAETVDENPAMEWGTRLEAVIAAKYAEAHSVIVERPEKTFRNSDHDFMLATPDGIVKPYRDMPPTRGLEVKTAGLRSAHLWGEDGDAVPEQYLVQCAWYMPTLDVDRWDLAALIGGQDYREYKIMRDAELETRLIELGENFWTKNVLKRIPPEPDASESAKKAIGELYKDHGPDLIQANAEAQEWAFKLKDAKERMDAAKGETDEAQNHLKHIIAENAGLEGAFGRITWKRSKDTEKVDWESVARALNAPGDVIKRNRSAKPGSRRFLTKWTK